MTASQKEESAIVVFLGDMSHARNVRRRLFDRAAEEPEEVLLYLNSLPEGVEQGDELLQKLRSIATAAIEGRIQLTD